MIWKIITKTLCFLLLISSATSCDTLCTSCPIEEPDSVGITCTDQYLIDLFLWSAPVLFICILSLIGVNRIEKNTQKRINQITCHIIIILLIILMILPGLNVLLFFLRFIVYPFLLGVGHIMGWTIIILICCIPLYLFFGPIIEAIKSNIKIWKRILVVLIWGSIGCMGLYYLWSYIGDWIIEHLSNISFSDIYPMVHVLVVGVICYIVYKVFLE